MEPRKILTEKPPRHPARREEVLGTAVKALREGEWARLEGAPETERALQEYHGGGIVWFVASGTAALEAILLGHSIGEGDEVITTPYTWGATVSAVLAVGAVPVFADVDRRTGLLDPDSVEAVITARTRAVLAVHLFGWPCDAGRLAEICGRRGIALLEDGSQAHGARWRGERVGRFGAASAFSCMGLKPLAGTEGGYAIFENAEAAERAYLYGRHPRGLEPQQRERLEQAGLIDSLQLGWRPCAVSAALVKANLPYLDEENAGRRENARMLRELLKGCAWISLPEEPEEAEPVYHLLSLLYDAEASGVPYLEYLGRVKLLGGDAFSYISCPIHRLPRMNYAVYEGPRVMWHDTLRRAGMDYRGIHCPGAEWRSVRAIEMVWNWTVPNEKAMEQLAQVLIEAGGSWRGESTDEKGDRR